MRELPYKRGCFGGVGCKRAAGGLERTETGVICGGMDGQEVGYGVGRVGVSRSVGWFE